jgi:hypothetical protein
MADIDGVKRLLMEITKRDVSPLRVWIVATCTAALLDDLADEIKRLRRNQAAGV